MIEDRGKDPDWARIVELARQIRRDCIRMIRAAGSGHPGGALGAAEILATLYAWAMRHGKPGLRDADRDRLVLSNGHICAAQYAAMARVGLIPLIELASFRRLGSRLQGHPSRAWLPGLVDTSTGPLGQGFSVANGLALGLRLSGGRGRVYCIVGDGEMQEGQVWEALMTAAQHRLSNVLLFVSYNGIQIDGPVDKVKRIDPLGARLAAFGWNVLDIDGHDPRALVGAIRAGIAEKERPTAVVARTVMAKGVPFMEGLAKWHGNCPSDAETATALGAIGLSTMYDDFPLEAHA